MHLNPHMLPRGPLALSSPACAGRWSSWQSSGPCLPSSAAGTTLAMGRAVTSPELAQIRAIFQSPAELIVKHLGHSPLLIPQGPQGELCRNPSSQQDFCVGQVTRGPPGSLGGSPSALHLGGLPPSEATWAPSVELWGMGRRESGPPATIMSGPFSCRPLSPQCPDGGI